MSVHIKGVCIPPPNHKTYIVIEPNGECFVEERCDDFATKSFKTEAVAIEKLQAQIHQEKWIPVAFSLPDAYDTVSVVFLFNDQQYEEVGFCLENGFWLCKGDRNYRKEYIQKREAIMWTQIEKLQESAILWEDPTQKSEGVSEYA